MFLEKATLLLECLQEIVKNSVNNKRSCKFFKFPGLKVASEIGIASSSNNLCSIVRPVYLHCNVCNFKQEKEKQV